MFSTKRANDVFAAEFTDPLRAALKAKIEDSKPIFDLVGRLWAAAELALERLSEPDAHMSAEGGLAGEVKDRRGVICCCRCRYPLRLRRWPG